MNPQACVRVVCGEDSVLLGERTEGRRRLTDRTESDRTDSTTLARLSPVSGSSAAKTAFFSGSARKGDGVVRVSSWCARLGLVKKMKRYDHYDKNRGPRLILIDTTKEFNLLVLKYIITSTPLSINPLGEDRVLFGECAEG